ncbi:MAG: P-loop NTPase [Halodesulfurarchaeum sp.]
MAEEESVGIALAIASGKGGVGKTTTALNLGATMVEDGLEVAVVDFDLGMANLGTMVGLRHPRATVHDVLAGKAPLEAALHEARGLTIVPGSTVLADYGDADPHRIEDIMGALRERFEVVLCDVGAGLNDDIVNTLEATDAVLLVTTAELHSLTDATKTGQLVARLDVPVVGAVFTGTGAGEFDDVEGLATALGARGSVTVSVPADRAVRRSVRKGMPVVFTAPSAPATVAYRRLAASLEAVFDLRDETGAEEFEWVDPQTGMTDSEPGPVMEVPLETLIEEAGLTTETEPSSVLARVSKFFD